MGKALDKALLNNRRKYPEGNEDRVMIDSLKDAFNDVEESFLKIARAGYELGFPQLGRVGACALVVVVANNKLYTANAGDSQGLVFEVKDKELAF